MRFSDREIKDLIVAWVLISVAFGIALRTTTDLLTNIWISALTVGVGFLVHELAHKFTAQHYKKFAEFRANLPMLIVALALSFSGFVIAAPGAVIISGFVNRKENGIISAAGPLSNIVLALILLPLYFIFAATPLLSLVFGFGFLINSWLALFNLIPFWIFDGAKVINWNRYFYGAMVVVSVILVFISNQIYSF